MSTFQDIQDRVNNDYLNRDTFIEETKRAIKAAIRHYQYERRTFNETATAIACSSGQAYISLPSNLLVLDDLWITVNGIDLQLKRETPKTIRQLNSSVTTGQPTHYSIYQNRVNLFAVPDSAYAVNTYYLKELPELSAGADTNAWISGGWEDVIAFHAAKLMWANTIRNDREALKFGTLERSAYDVMQGQQAQLGSGRIIPTKF